MNKIFAPFLPPWVETGLQPAFYDMESGTVLQQTARMYAKVQQLTRLFNELSEETKTIVDEYVAKFIDLKDFVDDYFDNLDVQTEINNKLDEMAEDGTLADIISLYLNSIAIFAYDSVASMTSSANLTNGSYARTFGFYSANDGGGALYKIRNVTNDDVIDGKFIISMGDPADNLIAELIIENNEVNVKQIGAKTDVSLDTYVNAIIAKNYKVYIPTGEWITEPITIATFSGAWIRGDLVRGHADAYGTVLLPKDNNQTHVLRIGYNNDTSLCNNIHISDIAIRTDTKSVTNAMIIRRVQFSEFKNIDIREVICTDCALRIASTWECSFGDLMFRTIDADNALVFGTRAGSGNITANHFEFLSFENVKGNAIKFESDTGYSANTIDAIDYESGTVTFADETRENIAGSSYTPYAIIRLDVDNADISIAQISANNIRRFMYVDSVANTSRATDSIIINDNTTGSPNIYIGNITGVGASYAPYLAKGGTYGKLICGGDTFRDFPYLTYTFTGARVFKYQPSSLIEGFLKANGNNLTNKQIGADEGEVYICATSSAGLVATTVKKGDSVNILAKGNGMVLFGSLNKTVNSPDAYVWNTIDISSLNDLTDYNVRIQSNSTVKVKDFFFS